MTSVYPSTVYDSEPTPDNRWSTGKRMGVGFGLIAAGAGLAATGFLVGKNSQSTSEGLQPLVAGCVDATLSTQETELAKIDQSLSNANTALDEAQASGEGIAKAAESLEAAQGKATEAKTALIAKMNTLFSTCVTTDVTSLLQEAGINGTVELSNVTMPATGTEG